MTTQKRAINHYGKILTIPFFVNLQEEVGPKQAEQESWICMLFSHLLDEQ